MGVGALRNLGNKISIDPGLLLSFMKNHKEAIFQSLLSVAKGLWRWKGLECTVAVVVSKISETNANHWQVTKILGLKMVTVEKKQIWYWEPAYLSILLNLPSVSLVIAAVRDQKTVDFVGVGPKYKSDHRIEEIHLRIFCKIKMVTETDAVKVPCSLPPSIRCPPNTPVPLQLLSLTCLTPRMVLNSNTPLL